MTEEDHARVRRTGGRARTRYAKKKHGMRAVAEAATEEDLLRQERRVAQLAADLAAARDLLALMRGCRATELEEMDMQPAATPKMAARQPKPKPKPKSSFIKREFIESEEEEEEMELAEPEAPCPEAPAERCASLPPLAEEAGVPRACDAFCEMSQDSASNHSDPLQYAGAPWVPAMRVTSRSDIDALDDGGTTKRKRRRGRGPLGYLPHARLPSTFAGTQSKPLIDPFGLPITEPLNWADTDDGDLLIDAGIAEEYGRLGGMGEASEGSGESCNDAEGGAKDERLSEPLPPVIIGLIGHVAHGKSSVVRMLTGKTTMAFREERLANTTIKLGYADACIYRSVQTLRGLRRYFMTGGSEPLRDPVHPDTNEPCEFVRKVSFIDCPGHDKYTTTMLVGTSVMDAAIMVVAANEDFPQRQTLEHYKILKERKLRSENLIVVHNKIDLVGTEALQHLQGIRKLVGQESSVIPCSAVRGTNREALIASISNLPQPVRNHSLDASPVFRVVRSFDINKKTKVGGDDTNKSGGVIGGAILEGVIYRGDEITLYPGLVRKKPTNSEGALEEYYEPVTVTVVRLTSEGKEISLAKAGALIGMEINVPPHIAKGDRLVGQLSGGVGDNVELCTSEINLQSMARNRDGDGRKVKRLKQGDKVWVMGGARRVAGCVLAVDKNTARLSIEGPICSTPFERVSLMRDSGGVCKILAWGTVRTSIVRKPPPSQPLIILSPETVQTSQRVKAKRKPRPVVSKKVRAKPVPPGALTSDEESMSDFYTGLKVSAPAVPVEGGGGAAANGEGALLTPASRRVNRKAKGLTAGSSTLTEFSAPKPPPRNTAHQLLSDSDDDGLRLKKQKRKRRLADQAAKDTASESGDDCEGESDAVYAGLLYQGLDGMQVQQTRAYKIPVPRVTRMSRHSCAVANFPSILKALKREAEHVRAYISTELDALASLDPDGILILNRALKPSGLEVVLRKYAYTYVTCRMCSSGTTIDRLDKGLLELRCTACNAIRTVSSQQTSLYTAVKPGERRATRKKESVSAAADVKDGKDGKEK